MMFRAMVVICGILVTIMSNKKKSNKQKGRPEEAPGPKPWPIIGSLHLMAAAQAKGKIPYAAFTALKKIYGDVFSITLGTTKCVVVNSIESVREVLINKDSDFDGRPDFKRFETLFGGDKQNCKSYLIYLLTQKIYFTKYQYLSNSKKQDAVLVKIREICPIIRRNV